MTARPNNSLIWLAIVPGIGMVLLSLLDDLGVPHAVQTALRIAIIAAELLLVIKFSSYRIRKKLDDARKSD
ncbi:hypothetical protein [Streptomyces sp. NPDC093707]|uniref:hypothetical protein n=1 Tax=Streptomyces sp. NPDC093707 TaxID=3154984 RepID=UPI00344F3C9E